jgi:hypothetical protein
MQIMRAACAVGAVSLMAGVAPADVVSIPASRDNTLYQSATGALSSGSGPTFFAGKTASGSIRRGLIRFDLAAAGIPAGSTITGVQLSLNMSQTISFDATVSIYRLLKDWGEGASNAGESGGGGAPAAPGDATWLLRFFGDSSSGWSAAGGTSAGANPDLAATPSAAAIVGNALIPYTWGSTPEMVADAQLWLTSPAQNFGWIIIGDESTSASAKRFDSRETLGEPNRPSLTVTFTPPAAPCYANCDGSTVAPILNVNDFTCFLNKYAIGDSYANCDGSSIPPILNVNDFTCFVNRYAQGCP